jgi:hypothetical protein
VTARQLLQSTCGFAGHEATPSKLRLVRYRQTYAYVKQQTEAGLRPVHTRVARQRSLAILARAASAVAGKRLLLANRNLAVVVPCRDRCRWPRGRGPCYASGLSDSQKAFTTGDLSFFFSVHTPTRNTCSLGSMSSTESELRSGL